MVKLTLGIDVPDLGEAVDFYTRALGFAVEKLTGSSSAILSGAGVKVFLLAESKGSRDYSRHWTPVHLDILVDDLETAIERAIAAGAKLEREIQVHDWGRIANMADPFGHGFDLIQEHKEGS